MQQNRAIIFTHIQKTAGTSVMKELLYRNYAEEEICRFWGGYGIKKLITSDTSKVKVFTGHFPYGIHHFIKQPCDYFTVLREPIKRAISHYNFIKNNVGEPGSENKYKELHQRTPLQEIFDVNSKLNPFKGLLVDNMQTRMLAGYLYYPLPRDSSILLKKAMNKLEKHYKEFGIQERYKDSMKLIANSFEWEYKTQDLREKKTVKKDEIDSEEQFVLEQNHKLDLELYNFAVDLFNQRVTRING